MHNTLIGGQSVLLNMREEALLGIERDSKDESLWESLHRIECPVLLLRGERKTPFGTLISGEDLLRYTRNLSNVTIETFEQSGHLIYREEPLLFLEKVGAFLEKIDSEQIGSQK